jgi:GAF domain-containing protein
MPQNDEVQSLMQSQRFEQLAHILELNAALSDIRDETLLLERAVQGIQQILALADVTILESVSGHASWLIRATTSARLQPGAKPSAPMRELLMAARRNRGLLVEPEHREGGAVLPAIANVITIGPAQVAIIAHAPRLHGRLDLPLYLRAFAQNLALSWQNIRLLDEPRPPAHENSVVAERHPGETDRTGTSGLQAAYQESTLEMDQPVGPGGAAPTLAAGREIPLVLGDRPFGAVTLPDDITLGAEESDFVQALIREMGNALNNAYLLQATRSYSNQLRVAADVSRAATTILDRELLMKEVVELIRERFDLYYAGLFLVDENDDAVLRAATGEAGRIQIGRGHRLKVGGQSMIGQAIARSEAQVEQDVTLAQNWQPNPLLPDTRSELALPLTTRGRTIGALTVQSSRISAFSEENVTVLTTLSDQLATAIENATLFVQIQETLAETNRLYRAGRRLTEARTALEVYQALVDFARESDLVDLAHIIAPDPGSADHLIAPAFWSRDPAQSNDGLNRFPREMFPFSLYLGENRVIVIEDGQLNPTLDPTTRRFFENLGIRALALVPIHLENRWLATLALDRFEAHAPSLQELQPFLTLCDQAAVILANQQLLNETGALYRISRALNQAISQEDALRLTVDEVARHLLVDQCRIVLYEPETGHGFVAAANARPEQVGAPLPAAGDSTFDLLQSRHQPLLLEDDGGDDCSEAVRRHLRPFGIRKSMLFPAISQQELVGFLALDSFAPGRD